MRPQTQQPPRSRRICLIALFVYIAVLYTAWTFFARSRAHSHRHGGADGGHPVALRQLPRDKDGHGAAPEPSDSEGIEAREAIDTGAVDEPEVKPAAPAPPTPASTPGRTSPSTPAGTPPSTPAPVKPSPPPPAPVKPSPPPPAPVKPPPAPPAASRPKVFMTMAAGDSAGRHALALTQSLRDTGSKAPIVILLFRGGIGSSACRRDDGGAWFKAHPERSAIKCSGPETVAEEIISPSLVASFQRLDATLRVLDPIPLTKYTEHMPGGASTFWGMALNKLVAFNLTEYGNIVFFDSDTLVLQNVDNLLDAPTFTASFTYHCCNGVAPADMSGGLWVFEPATWIWEKAQELMHRGEYVNDLDGYPKYDAEGNRVVRHWTVGELNIGAWGGGGVCPLGGRSPVFSPVSPPSPPLQFAKYLRAKTPPTWTAQVGVCDGVLVGGAPSFTLPVLPPPTPPLPQPEWPAILDNFHGYVEDLRMLPGKMDQLPGVTSPAPLWSKASKADLTAHAAYGYRNHHVKRLWPGFNEGAHAASVAAGGRKEVWRALSLEYDQCAQSICNCVKKRHIPHKYKSLHITCLEPGTVSKPGDYNTEAEFMQALVGQSPCTRYYMGMWYKVYARASVDGGLPAPKWTGEDVFVDLPKELEDLPTAASVVAG